MILKNMDKDIKSYNNQRKYFVFYSVYINEKS